MSCEAPSGTVLLFLLPARSIKIDWSYTGDSLRGFRVTFEEKETATDIPIKSVIREVGPAVRTLTVNQLHLGSGQSWRARVDSLCEGCVEVQGPYSTWHPIP